MEVVRGAEHRPVPLTEAAAPRHHAVYAAAVVVRAKAYNVGGRQVARQREVVAARGACQPAQKGVRGAAQKAQGARHAGVAPRQR